MWLLSLSLSKVPREASKSRIWDVKALCYIPSLLRDSVIIILFLIQAYAMHHHEIGLFHE